MYLRDLSPHRTGLRPAGAVSVLLLEVGVLLAVSSSTWARSESAGGLGGTAAPTPMTAPAPSAPNPTVASTIQAVPLKSPVQIDGILDEAAWQSPSAAPLIQNEPDNGHLPRQRTDWWIAYDEEALYLACRMADAAPESIVCGLGRRDAWPSSDWIVLILDTFNDDRNGYEFALSPAGAIVDEAVYGDGAEDSSWDGIWEAKARVEPFGWTAEMRIPFSQLKFPNKDEQVWGINLTRQIRRCQERDDLMLLPRAASGFVSRFPDLIGIHGIRPRRRPELLSYGVGKGDFRRPAKGDPFHTYSDLQGDVGTDMKWGVTNDLTLSAALNPDFGQVEVDPAVVNLSDFETYYDERRPFFVEDATAFRFGQEGTSSNWNFNWMDPILFYSRRVGQAPQVTLRDHDYADVPGNTTILGAAKLQGTTGHTAIGVVTAWTAREMAHLESGGVRFSQVAEPLTGYQAARVLRARGDGRRGLGFMVTNTWRNLADAGSRSELPREAVVLGLDGWARLDRNAVWALRGYVIGSSVRGDASAIDALQRSSRHYYQRPDASQLHYNPRRTVMNGWMGRAVLNKESGRFRLNASAGTISPGFEANDAGFANRSDVINSDMVAGYRWVEPTRIFRNAGVNLSAYHTWDTGWHGDEYGYGLFWNCTLTSYWWGSGNFFYNPERQVLRSTRGGPAMRAPDSRQISFSLGTDDRKAVSLEFDAIGSRGGDGSGSAQGSLSASLRPKSSIKITCSPSWSWSLDHSGWVDQVSDSLMTATYGVRYLFSDLTYREVSLSTRVDWTFTPQLTLQAYVQPLIGVATYRDFGELARAGSYSFNRYGRDLGSTIEYQPEGNRYEVDPDGPGPAPSFNYDNPDFNFKSLKVNLVLRWEFQPGSTFYLVWTQSRADDRERGDFRFGRDVHSLFDTVGENGVQAKVTKWWGL